MAVLFLPVLSFIFFFLKKNPSPIGEDEECSIDGKNHGYKMWNFTTCEMGCEMDRSINNL